MTSTAPDDVALAGEKLGPPSRRVPDAPTAVGEKRPASDIIGPLAVFVGFVAIWYLLADVVLAEEKRFLLPTPIASSRRGSSCGRTATEGSSRSSIRCG